MEKTADPLVTLLPLALARASDAPTRAL